MILKALFQELNNQIKDKDEQPKSVLIELFCEALGFSWSQFHQRKETLLNESQVTKIKDWFDQWNGGKPLAYIVGEKDFYKNRFIVAPDVLIPRPETEILVEKALEVAPGQSFRFMDLGTGSGCIGLSIAIERPEAEGLLVDSSEKAIAIAEINKKQMGLTNVELLQLKISKDATLTTEWESPVDLIVANPPYIAWGDERVGATVLEHEPHSALFCESEGFECIYEWLSWSYGRLKPGGYYIFEFGEDQETEIAGFIGQTDYSIIDIISDYSGKKRFFKLKK